MHRPVGDQNARACRRRRMPGRARRRPPRPRPTPAPVLQAESTTQSASSLSARISSIVSSPSPSTPPARGRRQRERRLVQAVELTRHQAVGCEARYLEAGQVGRSLRPARWLALPRLSTFEGSACSASAIDLSSSAVSGRRGSSASSALSTPLELRAMSGASAASRAWWRMPRQVSSARRSACLRRSPRPAPC